MTVASSMERVSRHTASEINEDIRQRTEKRVRFIANEGEATPELIEMRLGALDEEWDIERVLQANAASVTLAGLALAAFVNRRWLALPAGVAGFLLQHAVQGWCPPLPVLRRLGFRTAKEIAQERFALKALRGDFDNLPDNEDRAGRAEQALSAARRR